MPTPEPSRVRYHSRPAELNASGVLRATGLSPEQLRQLEQFIEQQLGGKRYAS